MASQYVGIDLHRRRSVIVRQTPDGQVVDAVRIDNTRSRGRVRSPRPARIPRWSSRRPTGGCATRRGCAVRRWESKEVRDLFAGLSQQPGEKLSAA